MNKPKYLALTNYIQMITYKTATLIGTSLKTGALIGDARPKKVTPTFME
ncbi:MAG: hypothetical protein ABI045_07380 [Flavobacteriales bacterium]